MFIATGSASPSREPGRQEPLGQILKRMELVTEAQVQEALEIQRKRGGVIGQILVEMGYVAQEEVLLALAAQTGMELLEEDHLMPEAPQRVRDSQPETVRFEQLEPPGEQAPVRDDLAHSPPVVKLLNLILLTTLKAGATELRLEALGETFTVRYRVDGILYDMESPPFHLVIPVIGRLLSESGMDISQRVRPQERRVRLSAGDRRVLVRVHYRPDPLRGESIILYFSEDAAANS